MGFGNFSGDLIVFFEKKRKGLKLGKRWRDFFDFCECFDGVPRWREKRDLTGKTVLRISANHSIPPFEHWVDFKGMLGNRYGGNYSLAERIDFIGPRLRDNDSIFFGAVVERMNVPLSGSSYDYWFVSDNTSGDPGHISAYNGIGILGNDIVVRVGGTTELTFQYGGFMAGRKCAIGARLFLDGVCKARVWVNGEFVGEGVTGDTRLDVGGFLSGFSAGSTHHNRVFDGGMELVVGRIGGVEDGVVEEWSRDPWGIFER